MPAINVIVAPDWVERLQPIINACTMNLRSTLARTWGFKTYKAIDVWMPTMLVGRSEAPFQLWIDLTQGEFAGVHLTEKLADAAIHALTFVLLMPITSTGVDFNMNEFAIWIKSNGFTKFYAWKDIEPLLPSRM